MLPPVIRMQRLDSSHFESHGGECNFLVGNSTGFPEKSWFYGGPPRTSLRTQDFRASAYEDLLASSLPLVAPLPLRRRPSSLAWLGLAGLAWLDWLWFGWIWLPAWFRLDLHLIWLS